MLTQRQTLQLLEELHSAIIEAHEIWDAIEGSLEKDAALKIAA